MNYIPFFTLVKTFLLKQIQNLYIQQEKIIIFLYFTTKVYDKL